MKIELAENGYERIETTIQEIEKQVLDGMFKETNRLRRFQEISSSVKRLRQILREVLLIVPAADKPQGKGDAA
jgi:DNA-binding FadR family transcriptional regulator